MAYGSYGDTVRNGLDWLRRFDTSVLVTVGRRRTPWIDRVMTALTRAGELDSWCIHGFVLLLVVGPSSWQLPSLLTAGALAATMTSQILKRTFRRPRPEKHIEGFVALLEDPDAFSFPSGHTAVAFGVAAALATGDTLVGMFELVFAMAIGCSRVYLGAHYPADVVVGAAVGLASGSAAAAACWAIFV
jgi:undecaprenyl-diphosphatase